MTKGDASPEDLYRAVGHALSRWEFLEISLAKLFSLYCQTAALAPEMAYGSTISFSARRDMLEAASQNYFYFQPDEAEQGKELLNEIGKLNGLRNDIAHGIVMHFGGGYGDGWYLAPPLYSFTKNKHLIAGGHKYQYTASQIDGIREAFNAYQSKVVTFNGHLLELRKTWL